MALAAEPWRGLAKIQGTSVLGNRYFCVSIVDVVPETVTGDQATWEGTPGSSVTLRLEWNTTGAPAATFGPADTCTVKVRLPGDATDIGATWTPAIAGASGTITQTMHFDSNPLNGSADASRAGMIEIYFSVSKAAAPTWGAFDSRGTFANIPAAVTPDNARGYLRARVTLSSYSISNASLGGAEPASFAFPDSIFQRATLDAVWYRSLAVAAAGRQSSTDKRTDAGTAQTAVARDYSWTTTATTVSGLGRVNNGQWAISSTAADARFTVPSNTFGGSADREYEWAASGHTGSFTPSGANLDSASRYTVDPRITFTQLFQVNTSTFSTPPISGDTASGSRLTSQLGFTASRATNARSEGVNSLAWTEKIWDNGTLTGTEGSPTHSRSTTSQAQGGQDGWSDAFLAWSDSLPGGSWTMKEAITTTDATGLELTPSRTLTLVAINPAISLRIYGNNITNPSRHLKVGDGVRVHVNLVDTDNFIRVLPDAGTIRLTVFRMKTDNTVEYLKTDFTWTSGTPNTAADTFLMAASVGDPTVFYYDFSAVQTANWLYDVRFGVRCLYGGTPYTNYRQNDVPGDQWKHDDSSDWSVSVLPADPVVRQGSVVPFTASISLGGTLVDADAVPSAAVYKRTSSGDLTLHASPTLTKRAATTGLYDGTFTASAIAAAGTPEDYQIVITAIYLSLTRTGEAKVLSLAPCS